MDRQLIIVMMMLRWRDGANYQRYFGQNRHIGQQLHWRDAAAAADTILFAHTTLQHITNQDCAQQLVWWQCPAAAAFTWSWLIAAPQSDTTHFTFNSWGCKKNWETQWPNAGRKKLSDRWTTKLISPLRSSLFSIQQVLLVNHYSTELNWTFFLFESSVEWEAISCRLLAAVDWLPATLQRYNGKKGLKFIQCRKKEQRYSVQNQKKRTTHRAETFSVDLTFFPSFSNFSSKEKTKIETCK